MDGDDLTRSVASLLSAPRGSTAAVLTARCVNIGQLTPTSLAAAFKAPAGVMDLLRDAYAAAGLAGFFAEELACLETKRLIDAGVNACNPIFERSQRQSMDPARAGSKTEMAVLDAMQARENGSANPIQIM